MTHRILQPPGWPRPKGYANGISARGRMIFTAGVIGWDENESVRSHVLSDQFAQTLDNILAILAVDGAGPEHIVRMTIYVTNKAEYSGQRDDIAPVWKARMGSHYPAIALVEVKGLLNPAAKVEAVTVGHHPVAHHHAHALGFLQQVPSGAAVRSLHRFMTEPA